MIAVGQALFEILDDMQGFTHEISFQRGKLLHHNPVGALADIRFALLQLLLQA